MRTHRLKIHQRYWDRLHDGTKTCEVRKNDRDFQTHDLIQFDIQWESGDHCADYVKQSERAIFVITHIIPGGIYGIDPEYCVLSVSQATPKQIDAIEENF